MISCFLKRKNAQSIAEFWTNHFFQNKKNPNQQKCKIFHVGEKNRIQDLYEYEYIIYKVLLNEEDKNYKYQSFHQQEFTLKDRNILIGKFSFFHFQLCLRTPTFYRFIDIFNKYINSTQVPKRELMLSAAASLKIAVKFEEHNIIPIVVLINLCNNSFTQESLLKKEYDIFTVVEKIAIYPTPYDFIAKFIHINIEGNDIVINYMVRYVLEYMQILEDFYGMRPSKMAAIAYFVSRFILQKQPLWNDQLTNYTRYHEIILKKYASILCGSLNKNMTQSQNIREKYANAKHHSVSKIPVPKFDL